MSENKGPVIESEATGKRVSELRRVIKVMFNRWIVLLSAFIILALIIVAIFAPVFAPHDPNKINLKNTLAKPSSTYLLGTDDLGRDILSRTIYGSRISLVVGIVGVFIAGLIGIPLGLIAGYFRGWINISIMRFIDALLALPPMVLILAIAAVLGQGLVNVLIAIGIGMMPTYCRLMCGEILSVKENEYITAARAMGAGNFRIMFLHLLPNSLPPLMVLITMNLGVAILMEAGLSYIGIGITPPTATWGSMVSDGYKYLLSNPLISFVPGFAILLVVLAFNMLGDGFRDALDPRLRGILQ
jgi:peptide/nickel transport system permease protein